MSVKTKAKDLRVQNQQRSAEHKARANRGEDLEYRARDLGIRDSKAYKREKNIKFF